MICLVTSVTQYLHRTLFIRGKKLNIWLVFFIQSYFKVPEDVRLISMYYFLMKILDKNELQQIAINHSSDIEFNDATLPACNQLRFRRSILKEIHNNHDNGWKY